MNPIDGIISPLDPESPVEIEWSLTAATVVARWRKVHGVDVTTELGDVGTIHRCRCVRTRLGFSWPVTPGGPKFYERLEQYPWYYRSGKWEHAFACAQAKQGGPLLDVGCGRGEFLAAAAAAGIEAEGIDFNDHAIAAAQTRGLRAHAVSVADLAAQRPESFAVVTALQVLEHIPAPRSFLVDCLRVLRPGGRLVIAVPDADGWLARAGSVLELPPHHATHWNGASLRALADLLPMDLVELVIEPLSVEQLLDFAAATVRPCSPDGTRAGGIWRRLVVRATSLAIKPQAIASRLPCATLAAVFIKR